MFGTDKHTLGDLARCPQKGRRRFQTFSSGFRNSAGIRHMRGIFLYEEQAGRNYSYTFPLTYSDNSRRTGMNGLGRSFRGVAA